MARPELPNVATLPLLLLAVWLMAGGAIAGDTACSKVCLAFEFMAPPTPAYAYPPLSFFYGSNDNICYDAIGNITAYLDQPLFKAADSGLISQMVSGFAGGDRSCGPNSIKWCATFASQSDAVTMQETVRRGAEQILNNFFCPAVPGGNCLPQLDVSAVCQPLRPPFPSCECNKKRNVTPLRLVSFPVIEPGRTSKTTLYCFRIGSSRPSVPPSPLHYFHTDFTPSYCSNSARFLYVVIPVCRDSCLNPCTSTYLLKAEIWADDTKRRAVRGTRTTKYRGDPVWGSPSWMAFGENTLKITPLNWTMSEAVGGEICIEISNELQQLSDLCIGGSWCVRVPVPAACVR
ncbi:hypothetical protein VOLCADRAFT_95799 [Volvox carteri f. nagariensis]|uniref:Pherophorin domain-containing protein n=1 Tax=Volvox carteri f. nagariensis TaxID=3068 RepID=D8U8F0_VOLCA|nr:uncharacterized protein VOLCADRAFT_95799 [Volvox carteri f. nagariensis]EFJ43965.1 hypothetical protein VOLCADRAFT_95799 [Volvox carteri f. nagariensis]|eukprot:XP_002954977.1 hypothetical protein VOLCADRAFT_95799 [Volvox carteri f. nagariensis]